jgi:hypothetical protein
MGNCLGYLENCESGFITRNHFSEGNDFERPKVDGEKNMNDLLKHVYAIDSEKQNHFHSEENSFNKQKYSLGSNESKKENDLNHSPNDLNISKTLEKSCIENEICKALKLDKSQIICLKTKYKSFHFSIIQNFLNHHLFDTHDPNHLCVLFDEEFSHLEGSRSLGIVEGSLFQNNSCVVFHHVNIFIDNDYKIYLIHPIQKKSFLLDKKSRISKIIFH